MVSVRNIVNKQTPTVNSTCKLLISKRSKSNVDELDTAYLSHEGEVTIDLEEVDTKLDLEFRKVLLQTKLGDCGKLISSGLEVEFELLDIVRTEPIHLLSDEAKLAKALHHKEKGSELFKRGKHAAAFERFRMSAQYLIFMTDKTMLGGDQAYATVCNNMAMCQIKASNHQHAIDLCSKVLTVDETNEKALYRRASCYVELKQFEKAHGDLALLAQSKDPSVKKLMEKVQEQRKVQHEAYKTVVKNMFR